MFSDQKRVYLLMEYVPGGELFKRLREVPATAAPSKAARGPCCTGTCRPVVGSCPAPSSYTCMWTTCQSKAQLPTARRRRITLCQRPAFACPLFASASMRRGTPCIHRGKGRTWRQAPGRRLGLAEARFYAAGVALALDYLHSRGVLYRCAAGFPQPARAARGSQHAQQMAHTVFSKC